MKKSTELVFIPAPGMGHLVPMVELAKKLVDRDDRLSVTFLILKLPIFTNEVVDAYIESLTAAGTSSIRFIKLPALQQKSASLVQSTSPGLALLGIFIEESKPHIQQTITKLFIDDNSSSDSGSSACRRLGGLVIDFFFTTLIDVGNKLGVPTYLHFASSAAMLGFMLHCPTLDPQKLESEVIIPSYVNPVPYSVLPISFLNKGDDMYHFFLYNSRRFKETKGIMVNSFYSLETHAFNSFSDSYQGQIPPVYPVGPVLDLKAGQDQLQPDRASSLSTCKFGTAAATMLVRAGFTSPYLRVLSPQSGFTQRMLVSSTASILLTRSAISSVDGILGEWMSYTPGPIPAPYFTPLRKTDKSFSSDREFSMVITSASISMIE